MLVIQRGLDWLAGFLMILGGVALILMMLQITAEASLRTAFDTTIPGTEETVIAYYMIACAFLPLAWVQRNRGHVRVEVLTLWMPARVAAGIDGMVYLLCSIATGIFAYATLTKAIYMTKTGEMLIGTIDVVVWPSRWILPVGLGAMMLYMILHAVADLRWAVRGGERLLAPPSGELH